MKIFSTLLLSLATLVTAIAQPVKPLTLNEMAATLRVQPQVNGGSLQRIPLPADLIMHSQSADLNDLRLFKSSGEPVPFALRSSESEATEEQELRLRHRSVSHVRHSIVLRT